MNNTNNSLPSSLGKFFSPEIKEEIELGRNSEGSVSSQNIVKVSRLDLGNDSRFKSQSQFANRSMKKSKLNVSVASDNKENETCFKSVNLGIKEFKEFSTPINSQKKLTDIIKEITKFEAVVKDTRMPLQEHSIREYDHNGVYNGEITEEQFDGQNGGIFVL